MLEFAARLDEKFNTLIDQIYVNINQQGQDLRTKLKCAIMEKIALADKIALSLDLDVNESISKSLKYPLDTLIVDQPINAKYYSREQEDDETYLWAGFVKPGTHSFIVEDPVLPEGHAPY